MSLKHDFVLSLILSSVFRCSASIRVLKKISIAITHSSSQCLQLVSIVQTPQSAITAIDDIIVKDGGMF